MTTASYDFAGKVALVTGGVRGIGLGAAKAFARCGAHVAVIGRNPERGRAAEAEIAALGQEALYVEADVSQPGAAAHIVDSVIARYGRLDYAFNNASVEMLPGEIEHGVRSLLDVTVDEYFSIFNTNVFALFDGMKHQIAAMLKNDDGGAIVNMDTMAGTGPCSYVGNVYAASRFAITGLTINAARDWSPEGIRINAVLPGGIRSHEGRGHVDQFVSRHPIGRVGTNDDVADAVTWLCSPHASFVVGELLSVDGGLALMT
jgi:NAD(P)-dependent dehydrogenase (short-subunit alcohol dehydrogenase family)